MLQLCCRSLAMQSDPVRARSSQGCLLPSINNATRIPSIIKEKGHSKEEKVTGLINILL
jgi:hypothetical protein